MVPAHVPVTCARFDSRRFIGGVDDDGNEERRLTISLSCVIEQQTMGPTSFLLRVVLPLEHHRPECYFPELNQ